MNTLPRAITAQWLDTPAAFWNLRRHWHTLLCSERRHALRAEHHLLYAALLGRDWRRGFTPPRNPRKLANGAFQSWALWGALWRLQQSYSETDLLAPFDGLVTPATLRALRARLPRPGDFAPEQFAAGAWPFDAYALPATEPAPHD